MHLPAATITLTLLSLYIANMRWDEASSESLNALQFAAKAHEVFILMSLGDILLYRICYGLSREDVGVPLGFLSSAFYLSAPLRFLVSRQLWVPTFRRGNNAKYQRFTGAMVVLVSILCMGASPLSAIAMIPRLDWWKDDMFDPFDRENNDYYPPRIKQIPAIEYPAKLDGKSGPFIRNNIRDSFQPRDSLIDAQVIEEGPETEFANLTYSNYGELYSLITTRRESKMASGTRPLSFVTLGLLNASMSNFVESSAIPWRTASHQQALGSGRGISWKQPVVTVECSFSSSIDNYTLGYSFLSLNKTVQLSLNSSTALAELTNRTAVDYRYPNLRTSKRLPISADILFGTTEEWHDGYTLCVILASWSEADAWIESPLSYNSLFQLERPLSNIIEDTSRDLIEMDDKWMEGIFSFSNESFLTSIADWCEGRMYPRCFALFLTLHITDALAQAGNNESWPEYFSDAKLSDTAHQDTILYTRYYYTYAYRFGSSRGILLAFSFLLLHVLMVLIHLVEVMRSKEPWQGSDWDNFGDMLVLALASKPPTGTNDLAQQSSKFQLWRKIATVAREGDEGHYQIRLREEKGDQRANEEEPGA
ncbi:hypothetical protein FPRO05_13438 [Fusarium proliferatum]|uniref:Uncharacterized protein n=1 Tax=Gibberella intermedia TaxID=948311 RepID=A0A365N1E3_GIBIN|nr:hypothetical protein FPRO05_13438 [Fusarium proliferatum]